MEVTSWILAFAIISGNRTHYVSSAPKGQESKAYYKTEAECKAVQQALLWDEQFIKRMFAKDYVISPTCIEVNQVKVRR